MSHQHYELWQRTILIGLVLFMLGMAAVAVFSSKLPKNCYSGPETSQTSNEQPEEECWGQRAVSDPVSVFTLLLVIVGGFQLALFWWQLNLIRDSADDAKLAAEAALRAAIATENSVVNASDTAQKQLRAWVFAGVSNASHDLPLSQKFTVNHYVTNLGLTPARVTRTAMRVIFLPHPLPVDFVLPIPKIEEQHTAIFPKQNAESGSWVSDNVLTASDIAQIRTDTIRVYFFGSLESFDIFGNPYVTKFCLSLIGNSINKTNSGEWSGVWEPTPKHNDFT